MVTVLKAEASIFTMNNSGILSVILLQYILKIYVHGVKLEKQKK